MQTSSQRLKDYWLSQGKVNSQRADEASLKRFEDKYRVSLPQDMRQYFSEVNGMEIYWPNDKDNRGFSFWSLERVTTVPEECRVRNLPDCLFGGAELYFVFADYLDWSWAYAINLYEKENNPVIIIGGVKEPKLIASSFTEFTDLYLTDSSLLYSAND